MKPGEIVAERAVLHGAREGEAHELDVEGLGDEIIRASADRLERPA